MKPPTNNEAFISFSSNIDITIADNPTLIKNHKTEKQMQKTTEMYGALFITNSLSNRNKETNQNGITAKIDKTIDFVVRSISLIPLKFISIFYNLQTNIQNTITLNIIPNN